MHIWIMLGLVGVGYLGYRVLMQKKQAAPSGSYPALPDVAQLDQTQQAANDYEPPDLGETDYTSTDGDVLDLVSSGMRLELSATPGANFAPSGARTSSVAALVGVAPEVEDAESTEANEYESDPGFDDSGNIVETIGQAAEAQRSASVMQTSASRNASALSRLSDSIDSRTQEPVYEKASAPTYKQPTLNPYDAVVLRTPTITRFPR